MNKLTKKEKNFLLNYKPRKFPLLDKSKKMAQELYHHYNNENRGGRNCGNLFLEWTKEYFWGMTVSKYIPIFEKTWKILDKEGYNKNNSLQYGDADVDVWIEYPKNKTKKVIVSTSHCSCADDNTHLFILEKDICGGITFRIATVWSREKHNKIHWGDDRDIDIPSLNTYRKRDFYYGYNDGRDEGHVLIYKDMYNEKRVDKAEWSESKIKHALWLLQVNLENIIETIKEKNNKDKV